MTDITSAENRIQIEETTYRAAVSESLLQRIGGTINWLMDDNTSQDSDISTNAANISSNDTDIATNAAGIVTNANAITASTSTIQTYTPALLNGLATYFGVLQGRYVKVAQKQYIASIIVTGTGLGDYKLGWPTTIGTINTIMPIGVTPTTSLIDTAGCVFLSSSATNISTVVIDVA